LTIALINDGLIEKGPHEISVGAGNTVDDRRNPVVREVLCKLPEDDYKLLKEKNPWFVVPSLGTVGWNGPIPENKSQVIYLAPHFNQQYSREEWVLIVAHEVAHSLLGHTGQVSSPEMEHDAWKKVIDLGFGTGQQVNELRGKLGQASL
jgi:hypothetical protein